MYCVPQKQSLMRHLCIYLYVPEHVTHHMPDVVNALRTAEQCGGSEVNTVQFLTQTDCFVSLYRNVSSRAAWFSLVLSVYVLFSLKTVEPIDLHYMTGRLPS